MAAVQHTGTWFYRENILEITLQRSQKNDARSGGIGKHLLQCAKQNRDSLSLHVYLKNERAVRFYKKEGFHIAGEQTDIETGEQEYLMEWKKKVL